MPGALVGLGKDAIVVGGWVQVMPFKTRAFLKGQQVVATDHFPSFLEMPPGHVVMRV